MDIHTLQIYNRLASSWCSIYRHHVPEDMYRLILTYFHAGKYSADVGCGCGRDVMWLVRHGFPAVGYDAASAMLEEARLSYPEIEVHVTTLPYLASISDGAYANVLCSATLMHLHFDEIPPAIHNLSRILCRGGRLIFSYRQSQVLTEREPDGRLFTTLSSDVLNSMLEKSALRILTTERQADAVRKGILWNVVVAEKLIGRQ
jgi:ubiquinone/menaquinone biosynthesis C-methylase UbiE